MVGHLASMQSCLIFHSYCWSHHCYNKSDANLKCNHQVYYWVFVLGISCCQHMLQSLWLQKYEIGDHLFARLQAWSLHEDSSKSNVRGTGTIVAAPVHLATAWWLMDTIPNICDKALLPTGSPCTCTGDHVFHSKESSSSKDSLLYLCIIFFFFFFFFYVA